MAFHWIHNTDMLNRDAYRVNVLRCTMNSVYDVYLSSLYATSSMSLPSLFCDTNALCTLLQPILYVCDCKNRNLSTTQQNRTNSKLFFSVGHTVYFRFEFYCSFLFN